MKILKLSAILSLVSIAFGQTDPVATSEAACADGLDNGEFELDESSCMVYVCLCFNMTGTNTCVTREYESESEDAIPYVEEICDPSVR